MIAYLVHRFPVGSQTFTYDEVRALADAAPTCVYTFRSGEDTGWPLDGIDVRALPGPGLRLFGSVLPWVVRAPGRLLTAARWALFGPFMRRPTLRERASAALSLPRGALLAREEGITLYHAQFANETATTALIAAHLSGRPFSFRSHGGRNPQLLREKLERARVVLAISELERSRLAPVAPSAHLVVSRLGVDVRPPADARRDDLVAAVGSLILKKGHAVLVDAVRRLAAQGRAVACEIAGEGPQRAALAELAAGAPVTILGHLSRDDVDALLRRAAVFAMPSLSSEREGEDGLPVALLEAMARGVPVVASRIAAIPEVVTDGETGLLVDPGDAAQLAAALARLLDDGELRERLGAAARARIAAEYDAERCYSEAAATIEAASAAVT